MKLHRNRNRSPDHDQPRRRRAPRPAVEHFGKPTLNGQRLPFSDAVRVGDMLYLSGQIGRGPDGKLPEGIEAQTKADAGQYRRDAEARRASATATCSTARSMLSDMKNWPAFNQVYVTYFPEGKLPARSAFGANGLAWALLESNARPMRDDSERSE